MSFSLYYEAKRCTEITEYEMKKCQEIADNYCSQYPFESKTEDFCIYENMEDDDEIIFSGSTKLPSDSLEMLTQVAEYWMKCLTEIKSILSNAVWSVSLDDMDLIFDENCGWRFPTDEEYEN